MSRASDSKLGELHELVCTVLTDALKGDQPSPQMLSAAIKFLKDNGIEAVSGQSDKVAELEKRVLETFDDADGDAVGRWDN